MGTEPPIQPPPPPAGPMGGAPMGGMPMGGGPVAAEWWKRLVAAIIDGIIVGIPSRIIGPMIFSGMFSAPRITIDPNTGAIETGGFMGRMLAAQGALALMTMVIGAAYFIYFHSSSGQTIGKKLMAIKVVDIDSGNTIDYGKAFVRWLIPGVGGWVTCFILPLLDGLWPLWDAKGQALHDKLANTLVIDA